MKEIPLSKVPYLGYVRVLPGSSGLDGEPLPAGRARVTTRATLNWQPHYFELTLLDRLAENGDLLRRVSPHLKVQYLGSEAKPRLINPDEYNGNF